MDDDFVDEDMFPMLLENAVSLLEENGNVPTSLQQLVKDLAALCDVKLPVGEAPPAPASEAAASRRQSVATTANLVPSRHSSLRNLMGGAGSANTHNNSNSISGGLPPLSGSPSEVGTGTTGTPSISHHQQHANPGSNDLSTDFLNQKDGSSGFVSQDASGGGLTDMASPSAASDGTNGSPTNETNKQVIPMRACVVCGQVRAGEQRKSGFKCYAHIGVPSSATFIQRVEELDFLDVKKFNLEKTPLGRGAFGKVHRATHIQSGQKFAVKILDRQQLEKMKMLSKIDAEISILKALSHPNIVKIYAVAESQDDESPKLFIMMEFLEGGQVCHIDEEGKVMERLPAVRMKKWLLGMAVGLQYMHEKGFVHRDIKPENILVDRKKDSVKLTDFGVSSDLSGEESNAGNGSVEGSPAFMPPELFESTQQQRYGLDPMTLGKAQDVWALGVTAFVMAFGYLPFFGKSRYELTEQVLNKPLPFPKDADPVTVDLISMMLQRDILKRCTMQDVLRHPFFKGVRIVKGIPVEADPITIRLSTFPLDVEPQTKIETQQDEEAEEDATVFLPPGIFPGTNPTDSAAAAAVGGFDPAFSATVGAASTNMNVSLTKSNENNNSNNNTSETTPRSGRGFNNLPTVPWTKAQAALGQFVSEATLEKKHLELVVGSTYSVTLCMSD